jgi:low temperature requirement protein LtrA
MENNKEKYAWSSKLGLMTGTFFIAVGLIIIYTKLDKSHTLPTFMICYGAFRLLFSLYQLYLKKKDNLTP